MYLVDLLGTVYSLKEVRPAPDYLVMNLETYEDEILKRGFLRPFYLQENDVVKFKENGYYTVTSVYYKYANGKPMLVVKLRSVDDNSETILQEKVCRALMEKYISYDGYFR